MPGPGFKVATDALRKEADLWQAEGDRIGRTGRDADSLRFTGNDAGMLRFMFVPEYHKVVDMVVARCKEGQDRMNEIRDTLKGIAAAYDAEEAKHLQGINRLGRP